MELHSPPKTKSELVFARALSGAAFWDFRAKWLKEFAAEHPDYHLQLPE
jgi:hypothetical protein